MEWQWIVAYLTLGTFVGFIAGLLGVGGGAVMVPILVTFLTRQGVPREQVMDLSLGTSMASIVLTAVSSVWSHQRHKAILWPVTLRMSIGLIAGTLLGTRLVAHLSTQILGGLFIILLLYVAGQLILNIKPRPNRQLPGPAGLTGVGLSIGLVSGLVAIGGGALTVPFLAWCNVHMRNAIATSAAAGLFISISGAVGYASIQQNVPGLPWGTVGSVVLPAVVLISFAGMLMAPLGAKAAHRLPVPVIKFIFALLLLALGVKMVHSLYIS